jgi:hypothetical protein
MEYLCHKWPRICSVCRIYNPFFSSFVDYHRIGNKINPTGVTRGAGTAYNYPSKAPMFTTGFLWGSYYSISSFLCSVLLIIVCLLPFFFWSLYCMSSVIYGSWFPLWYLRFTAPDYHFGIFKLFLQLPIFSKTDNSVYEMLLWIPRWENFNKLVIL